MGKFKDHHISGKCDFCDYLAIYAEDVPDNERDNKVEEILHNSCIKIIGKDGREHDLNINTIEDAAKYYPYLTVLHAYSCGKHSIVLSSTSFIDSEEQGFLKYKIDDVMKYYNRCKRKKEKFDPEKCVKELSWWRDNDDTLLEIAQRISKDGKKADFSGIHSPGWEWRRRRWWEDMVELGYSEIEAFNWCFNEFYPSDEVIKRRLGRLINREG